MLISLQAVVRVSVAQSIYWALLGIQKQLTGNGFAPTPQQDVLRPVTVCVHHRTLVTLLAVGHIQRAHPHPLPRPTVQHDQTTGFSVMVLNYTATEFVLVKEYDQIV